jgi:hypothetical protein
MLADAQATLAPVPSSRLARDRRGRLVCVVTTGETAGVQRGARLLVLGNTLHAHGYGFLGHHPTGRPRPGFKCEPAEVFFCSECNVRIVLSSRRARRYRDGLAQPTCDNCRHRQHRPEPTNEHVAWWRDNYSRDELRALASGLE